jgi:RNA polymerase sigma factor (TIGR02999 family)
MDQPPGTITRVVNAMASGTLATDADPDVRRVYEDLRTIAHRRLDEERNAPFQTTDLVHEAYLKLFRPGGGQWQSRAHFFGSAARAMEVLLIDSWRRRQRYPALVDQLRNDDGDAVIDPLRLSAALDDLAKHDRDLAELARLKLFGGVSLPLLAELTSSSERTASRRWTFARTWLAQRLAEPDTGRSTPP